MHDVVARTDSDGAGQNVAVTDAGARGASFLEHVKSCVWTRWVGAVVTGAITGTHGVGFVCVVGGNGVWDGNVMQRVVLQRQTGDCCCCC